MKKFTDIIPVHPLKIEKLVNGGQGIARLKDQDSSEYGKIGFFWNALPGESVTKYRLTKQKSSYFEAIALERNNSSPDRIAPKDQHFLSTSPWQILDYSAELRLKHQIISELFHELNAPVTPIITDHKDFFYRNKMEYSLYFDHSDQKIHLACHRRGSHQKIKITHSSLELPAIFAAAKDIISDLNRHKIDARKFQSILLRSNQQGQVSGGLLENYKPHPVFPLLSDQILGQTFNYSPNGFFQINLPLYEKALETIKPFITTQKVLDLYAGVGTIGLSVAPDSDLSLVEVDKSAFRELITNCQAFPKAKPFLAKSEEVLDFISSDQTVILDPPRAGCHPSLLTRLVQVCPPTIIYLSCNPITQLRDLKTLLSHYKIIKIQPFNFFPRTPHLENLVILQAKTC